MLGDQNNADLIGADTFNLNECALLVIDELGDTSESPFEGIIKPAFENTARLCDAARLHGIPVIFANDAHIKGIDCELDLWGDHCLAGTPEAQLAPQLQKHENDFVVEKRRYSAFFQTGLRLLLDELGISTLICTGIDTNICVRHTAADAYYNNFNIVVIRDATATFLYGDQEEGLAYMKACYAATIMSTEEALVLFEG